MEEFSKAMNELKEGEALALITPPEYKRVSEGDLALAHLDNKRLNDLLSLDYYFPMSGSFRPGWMLFQRHFELKYFHPSTPMNDVLVIIHYKWQGLLWGFIGVPKIKIPVIGEDGKGKIMDVMDCIRESVKFSDLHIVDEGMIPFMIGGNNPNSSIDLGEGDLIPANRPDIVFDNVLYLENKKDSVYYTNQSDAKSKEDEMIEWVENKYRAPLKDQQ